MARAWAVLATVLDPEVPALSLCDLGIVRGVVDEGEALGLEVVLTPTYSGCPATEVISQSVIDALAEAGLQPPAETAFRSSGKRGVHTEHMGLILAEMQHLQRAFPGGAW